MKQYVKNVFRDIRLALNTCHNTITTDIPGLHKVDKQHWRIDNSKEISMLNELERQLNSDTCPLCGHCKSFHENKHSSIR